MSDETFAGWLSEHGKGLTDVELTSGLTELLETCLLLDKPGRLVLTVNVKPESDIAVISCEVAVKAPKSAPAGTFYFRAPESGLPTRRDPNQPELPFAEGAQPARSDQ